MTQMVIQMNSSKLSMNIYSVLPILLMSLFVLTGCGKSEKIISEPQTTENEIEGTQAPIISEKGLTAHLEIHESLKIGEKVNLKFTLKNTSETPMYILKWYTPLEGFAGWIFRVTRNGQEIPYEGIAASRGAPLPDEYVYLEPGGSTSAIIDMASVYDFSKAGTYRIAFISPHISQIAYTEDEMAKSVDDLIPVEMPSNTVTLVLDDK